jgi:hypothetical protein
MVRTYHGKTNWTAEMDRTLVERVEACKTVGARMNVLKDIAMEFGCTAKAARMRLYVLEGRIAGRKGTFVIDSGVKVPWPDKEKVAPVKDHINGMNELINYITSLQEENKLLRNQLAKLEEQSKDYEVLTRLLQTTRKMIVEEDNATVAKPRFRMDQNGNLERY